jgi:hypothetical protein
MAAQGDSGVKINLSEEAIETAANKLRGLLKMEYVCSMNMGTVLDRLQKKSPKGFKVIVSSSLELAGAEAFMDCEAHKMHLSQKVSAELDVSYSRSRFTAAHELGHYVLGHSGNTKRNPDKDTYLTPRQKLQEREADIFASLFLVPTSLARSSASPEEIKERFQVSLPVAEIAFERVQSVIRKERGEKRQSPAAVIDFLKEAERQGYKVKSDISRRED